MNVDKMINMILIKISQKHDVFYMEKRSYKNNKIYKSFIVKIDNITNEYKSKTDMLISLKEMI